MLDGALHFTDGGWILEEDLLRTGARTTGALFATSNGYLGVRGARREPLGDDALVLVAGFAETRPYAHPERSYGIPDDYQTMVAVTDPTPAAITVDGVAVAPSTGRWLDHRRTLDLRTGCVTTTGTWEGLGDGGRIAVRTARLASFDDAALLWSRVEVEPLDGDAAVEVTCEVRANTGDRTFPGEPEALSRAWGRIFRPAGSIDDGTVVGLVHRTLLSGRAIACASDLEAGGGDLEVDGTVGDDVARRVVRGTAGPGRPLVVLRRAALVDGPSTEAVDLLRRAAGIASGARAVAFDDALACQRQVLDEVWRVAAVDLDGAPDVEAGVRFSIFQTFQNCARNPGRASGAKGLTGQGYEGHHMWDQEVYVGHALDLVSPAVARATLDFRVATLPQARERCAHLGHEGAQYPWRTIDGREASSFFPAGAAQHHLDADIAWAIEQHVECTGDESLLAEGGLEILVETARFWACIGRFDDDGRWGVAGATGPDEYTALVDDNLYTNLMAARNLCCAADRVDAAPADLVRSLGVEPDEVKRWREMAQAACVLFDDDLGVHAQDRTFLQLPRWDLEATPEDQLPLQDHHHLLTLYRHQVLKQADVVLATFLLDDRFTPEERRRAFDYYEPLTAHDSSLSAPIHAIVGADVGRLDRAWGHLRRCALGDLEDGYGTLADGLHLAAAAGAWLAVVCGFGGFRLREGRPAFRPQLPPGVERMRFAVRFRGSTIEVETTAAGSSYRLLDGPPLEVLDAGRDEPVPVRG